ncbi:unnamed protein product [Mytilus coruscus]|uniref:Putative CHCC zinc finger domain-containing protein n=1 Tax=Mytilus coruscus TaxID=42192 RepID=A0A6J8EW44_MYTCO|nr:unnamed protein product [Mytilus coruscus]
MTHIFFCTKKCLKQCDHNHICDRGCHFPFGCRCNVKINKTLPRCGHIILIGCSEKVDQFTTCNEQVDFILEICGHHKKISCSEKHKIETVEPRNRELYEKHSKCSEIVSVDLPQCGHTKLAECWKSLRIKKTDTDMLKYIPNRYDLKCSKEVVFNLECGHPITTMCYKKCFYEKNPALTQKEGKAGIECESMVELNLVCGHTTTVKCFERFRYQNMRSLLPSSLSLFRRYTNIKCTAMVDIALTCGHMGRTECWEKEQQMESSHYKLNVDCKALVEIRIGQCGHTKMVECYQRHTQLECHEKSVYTYPKCGHERFFECCQHPDMQKLHFNQTALRRGGMGRRYNYREEIDCKLPLCEHLIDKQLSCGHKIAVTCSMSENAV